MLGEVQNKFRNQKVQISIEDTLLSVVFFLFGAALFLPDTSLTMYGYDLIDYAFLGSLAALGAGYATNDNFTLDLDEMDQTEIGAVGGTIAVLIGHEYSQTVVDLIHTNEYTQIGALALTCAGWFIVAVK